MSIKTYADLSVEFSTLNLANKIHWISELSSAELKIFATGARQAPPDAYIRRWIAFFEEVITRRTAEDREERLNDLGILD